MKTKWKKTTVKHSVTVKFRHIVSAPHSVEAAVKDGAKVALPTVSEPAAVNDTSPQGHTVMSTATAPAQKSIFFLCTLICDIRGQRHYDFFGVVHLSVCLSSHLCVPLVCPYGCCPVVVDTMKHLM